ncbi:hypothetical protein TWF569_008692 [Orbilia oligospora]|uniref:CWH43-like N-terminal domain-containing protein n=1 Tax=Orbilia oligospora TaxID=2813651 RepID=A0A7C8K6Q1_ORBOL|nr:hypothetical protein TWF706_006825 [Orbilia oligospora]KAF3138586.1 hypothetical protein TWF569_008692 [Orbilia oligospora]KAF3142455.1 hypothetical protein TWF703_000844 [Orbilia oligospora]
MPITSGATSAARRYVSWYWFPTIGSIVWIGTLLGLLVTWIIEGSPYYESMDPSGQTIAYISDIGADFLKPLFITGSSITSVCFVLSLFGARWLRHRGRLLPNTSMTQRVLSIISIIGAVIGSIGLILLAVFDTKRYTTLHRVFLAVFCIGVLISALGTVLEYWRLERNHRTSRALTISMWTKLAFFIVELGLAVTFGVLMRNRKHNAGAVVEWVLGILFTGYLLSFNLDLLPATKSYPGQFKDMELTPPATSYA